eukprot:scaffold3015_cov122-Cylindrotheca_fusiformis.AAC.1
MALRSAVNTVAKRVALATAAQTQAGNGLWLAASLQADVDNRAHGHLLQAKAWLGWASRMCWICASYCAPGFQIP